MTLVYIHISIISLMKLSADFNNVIMKVPELVNILIQIWFCDIKQLMQRHQYLLLYRSILIIYQFYQLCCPFYFTLICCSTKLHLYDLSCKDRLIQIWHDIFSDSKSMGHYKNTAK